MSDNRLIRIEELLGNLIQMVGTTNARIEEVSADLKETKDIIHTFRSESDVNFKKLDRRVKLIESDLDETMVKVSEIVLPRN